MVFCFSGYNIRNDDPMPSALFATDDHDLRETPFGIKIPAGMRMHKVRPHCGFSIRKDSALLEEPSS